MSYIIEYGNGSIYVGGVRSALPHGAGEMFFSNGDRYNGNFYYGKFDGYGLYTYAIGMQYEGFFSYGKFHGVGTYSTMREVSKGTWREDTRHGIFHVKNIISGECSKCIFIDGILTTKTRSLHIDDKYLKTHEKRKDVPRKIKINADVSVCRICFETRDLLCNTKCGHMACEECWKKCAICPVCKEKKESVIKLYWD